MTTTSLVLGIVFFCLTIITLTIIHLFYSWLFLIIAIEAIILGYFAMRNEHFSDKEIRKGKIGMILGIISISIIIVWSIICIAIPNVYWSYYDNFVYKKIWFSRFFY